MVRRHRSMSFRPEPGADRERSHYLPAAARWLSPVMGGDIMTVKSILSGKGRDVLTIEPNAKLETAITMLAEHRIGALVVLGPERRGIGILSERDIVRVLPQRGAPALSGALAPGMTRKASASRGPGTCDRL